MGRRKSRGAMLITLVILLTIAWITFVFTVGRCCPPVATKDDGSYIRVKNVNNSATSALVSTSSTTSDTDETSKLSLQRIVFGIAGSSDLWSRRKEFIRLWWRAQKMRGFVWLEKPVDSWDDDLPPIKVSENTLKFKDVVSGSSMGHPTGIRIARIVLETFNMNLPDVDWFVLCDDDTFFSVENLVKVLSKYDSSQLYYIGSTSESHQQNVAFSYDMAFGGAGFAISYPLAKALVEMQDECLQHYPELVGSDDRLRACISELGVPLTKELGFHQCDVRGNALGLLAAHPVTPFVSLHHLEVMEPLFPNMDTLQSLQTLSRSMQVDSSGFLQQAICYDHSKGLTFSIAAGYVVQVFPEMLYPKVLEKAEITFSAWNRKHGARDFDLDSRDPFWICKQPFLYYLEDTYKMEDDGVIRLVSLFKRYTSVDKRKMMCWSRAALPESIRVVAEPLSPQWFQAPRRQCCQVGEWTDGELAEVKTGTCRAGETIIGSSGSRE